MKKEELKDYIYKLALIFSISGIFGFIYEILFYRIDLGYWVNRGTTLGPWIPIYGFGGISIAILTRKLKDKPFVVFLLSTLISGILEFSVGYIVWHVFKTRLWDYNVEIWNWGNIGGYVCYRSVLFFGVSGLLLNYAIIPIVDKIKEKMKEVPYKMLCIVPTTMFVLDMIISNLYNLIK